MLGAVSEIGASTLRLWVAAGSAALLVAFIAVAVRTRARTSTTLRVGLIVLAALAGATFSWAFLAGGERGDARADLEMRARALRYQALAPGSPLACLDGLAGESIEVACEREIFASPASLATTISYTAARLALLSDIVAYGSRYAANVDDILLPLRRSLEVDRFGILAHVLATRDGCTSENCKELALFGDSRRLRANLADATLPRFLEHYLLVWSKPPDAAVADAKPAQPTALAQAPAQAPHPVNIDFPTAASIPAISIMNPEPTGPVLPGVAAAAAANPNGPQAGSRRAKKQAANPPPPMSAPAPAANPPPAVDPIWPEPVPPPPSQTTASPAAPPAAAGPVQLNPFPNPPQASAGMAVRAQ
jgi:hypothetical protein